MLRSFARLQRPGQQKPQGVPRIDWTHPLTQGLLFYGFDTGTGLILDLVSGRVMNTVGTLVGQKTTSNGTGIAYSTLQSNYFNSDTIIQAATAAPPWTCATGFQTSGALSNNAQIFSRTANNSASQPFANWGFQASGGLGQRGLVNNGGSLGTTATGAVPTTNVFSSLVMVARSSSTLGFYQDGAQVGADTTGLSIASANTDDAICFNGNSSASVVNPANNVVVFFGMFAARAWSADEIVQLHRDPYCFLIPAEAEMPAMFTASTQIATLYSMINVG